MLTPPMPPLLLLVSATAGLGAAALFVGLRRFFPATLALCGTFAVLGGAARMIDPLDDDSGPTPRSSMFSGAPVEVSGTLRREPELLLDATRLEVDATRFVVAGAPIAAELGIRVRVSGAHQSSLTELGRGDRLRFWANLRAPTSFGNPGGFDLARYLSRRGVRLVGSVKSGLLVHRVSRADRWRSFVSSSRAAAVRRIESAFERRRGSGSDEVIGIVIALVTGDRTRVSAEMERRYRRAGLLHVMAISGAHVAIWVMVLRAGLVRLGLTQRTTLLAILLLLPLYAVFCGGRAPVVRAAVMAGCVVGARLLGLPSRVLNGVGVAAIALVAASPTQLEDAGFQLTFAAMASIGVLYAPLSRRLHWLGVLAAPVSVAIAAQLGVLPIGAWHFHRAHPLAVVTGLPAVPVAGAVCVLGVLVVLTASVPIVSSLSTELTHFAVSMLTHVAEFASAVPGASLRVARPSLVIVSLYLGCLLLWRSIPGLRRFHVAQMASLAVLVGLVGWGPVHGSRTGELVATFLDVGHGDAVVLCLPDGEHVLIDAGGLPRSSIDVGEDVVIPYLLDHGARKLDAVVASHADYDHIGGLAAVIDELRVDALWDGAPEWDRAAYRKLRASAATRSVPVQRLEPGSSFGMGGARFEVLSAGELSDASTNDRSVVLRLSFAGRSLLLTGDAEAALERRLVASGVPLRSDVLKVAHHGSASSSSPQFLDAVAPRLAVLSTREIPHRPIPSPIVLARLEQREIDYARTDRDGAITVTIGEGGELEWSTVLRSR